MSRSLGIPFGLALDAFDCPVLIFDLSRQGIGAAEIGFELDRKSFTPDLAVERSLERKAGSGTSSAGRGTDLERGLRGLRSSRRRVGVGSSRGLVLYIADANLAGRYWRAMKPGTTPRSR